MGVLNKPEGYRVVEKDGVQYAAGLYCGENLGGLQPVYSSFKIRTPAGVLINMCDFVPLTALKERMDVFDAICQVVKTAQPELTDLLLAEGFWEDNIAAAAARAEPEISNKITALYSSQKAKESL